MNKHTLDELKQWQALPLEIKEKMTINRIRGWVEQFGESGVYVSFSGGKDSTVLLDIVRNQCGYRDIPAVFVDTGLEYPELRDFVKTFENVIWLKPEMNFKKVIKEFGYPFISKEVSGAIEGTNVFFKKLEKKGIKIPGDKLNWLKEQFEKGIDFGYKDRLPGRALKLIGKVPHKENGEKTGQFSKMFDESKWGFLIDFPYGKFSNKCCYIMKKNPMNRYEKETGRKPITGQMACESMARRSQWLKRGCNAFEGKHQMSNPLSFWTEQDILHYIKKYNLGICKIYGEIIEKGNYINGQMCLDCETTKELQTTGAKRTGCMFCGFGCHLEKESRFESMKKTHPKQYEWIMKPLDEGGLGYRKVIDWLNENGKLKIKY